MTKEDPRRIPEEKAASPQEIQQAIEDLTPVQLLRLEKYARWRIRGLGRKATGRNHEDLLADALTATLARERRWNREAVDFFGHLKGAIRSISDNWSRKSGVDDTYLETEFYMSDSMRNENSPLMRAPDTQSNSEQVLGARQILAEIECLFVEDSLVYQIIEQLREGMTGAEIQETLQISKKEFETAMKRMRRKVRRVVGV